jgi:hypothetical protein
MNTVLPLFHMLHEGDFTKDCILFPVMLWWTMKLQGEMCGEVLKMLYGRYLLMLAWNLLSSIYKGSLM